MLCYNMVITYAADCYKGWEFFGGDFAEFFCEGEKGEGRTESFCWGGFRNYLDGAYTIFTSSIV